MRRSACLAFAAILPLGGCAATETVQDPPTDTAEPVPWSTKAASVLRKPTDEQPLAVDPDLIDRALSESMRGDAVAVLQAASRSQNALIRMNALEAFHLVPAEADEAIRRAVVDENRAVRFAAAMTVGELRITSLAHLLEPMLADPSESVQAAAIYGLRRNGVPVDLNPLAGFLRSSDPEIRANAAFVLGELGDRSAIPMLRHAMGRGMSRVAPARARLVDMQIAEAMVKLGEEGEIEGIRAGLFASDEQGEVVALACQMCGRLRDAAATRNLIDLATRSGQRQQPAEIRMAATAALARIDQQSAPAEVPMSYATDENWVLRAQAALTLGELGRPANLPTLAALMGDPNPVVQVSAAAAILQIDSTIASAGNQGGY